MMFGMFIALLLSSSLFLSEPAVVPDHPLTISELVDIALSNNPDSKVAWWNAQRAASSVDAAKSEYYPKLDLGLGASHGRDFEFINGPNRKYTQTSADLSLSMILFDFGERSAQVEARKKALEAANWEADFSLQKVMINALGAAYELLHTQEVVTAARITRDDAKKMLDASLELQRIGHTSISDVYSSKATFAEMQMNLAKESSECNIKRGKLAQVLGFGADTNIELAPLSSLTSPKKEDTAALIARAKEQRKDLHAKAAQLQEAHANLEKSYSSYLPKLILDAKTGIQHYHHDHTKAANYDVGLTLKIPLFSGLDSIYNNRMAYADTKKSLQELSKLELDIAYEVLSANLTHEAASEMLTLAAENAENALLAYEAALEKYRAGKEQMFEATSNALQKLAIARVRYSEVKTQWLTSLAKLAYATGTIALNTR